MVSDKTRGEAVAFELRSIGNKGPRVQGKKKEKTLAYTSINCWYKAGWIHAFLKENAIHQTRPPSSHSCWKTRVSMGTPAELHTRWSDTNRISINFFSNLRYSSSSIWSDYLRHPSLPHASVSISCPWLCRRFSFHRPLLVGPDPCRPPGVWTNRLATTIWLLSKSLLLLHLPIFSCFQHVNSRDKTSGCNCYKIINISLYLTFQRHKVMADLCVFIYMRERLLCQIKFSIIVKHILRSERWVNPGTVP